MDRELIEEQISNIQEQIRDLIDKAYMCGYKNGYIDCLNAKCKNQNRERTERGS